MALTKAFLVRCPTAESSPTRVPPIQIICPVCPAGAMTHAVETKAAHIYVCYGCGASLSTCTGEYQSPDKRE